MDKPSCHGIGMFGKLLRDQDDVEDALDICTCTYLRIRMAIF